MLNHTQTPHFNKLRQIKLTPADTAVLRDGDLAGITRND